jgi:hypothetical protein
MRRVDSDIVLRNWLNSELAASFHLQAIDADILNIVVVPVIGVAADYARFVEEEDPVAAVEPEQRNQASNELLLESVLMYPVCGFAKRETMSTDACRCFYQCAG